MAEKSKKYLVIVDGNALLHRAWHAIPPLTTKSGQLVHGAYGFTMIFLGAIKKFQPACVAVTFDLAGKTFRHEEYEAYKATREKKPDELYAQIPVIERILAAMDIPVYTAKGFEADDVIGTIAKLANALDKELESIIVTGDMDTLQLIDERTKVFTLRKGMSDTVTYDTKAVRERYGLDPDQMIDYKALRGDPSDNIPGVKGIGEKTATELLQTFGTLDALYESLEKNDKKAQKLKPGVREKLVTHKKEAYQAQGLCTIRRDVPLDFSLERCAYAPVTRDRMTAIFEELQFVRLLNQLPESTKKKEEKGEEMTASLFGDAKKTAATAPAANVVKDIAGLSKVLAALRKVNTVTFRTLTENDDPVSPRVIAFGLSDDKKTAIIDGKTMTSGKAMLKAFFTDSTAKKICHDLKREQVVFHALGLPLAGETFDMMIASYLLHSGERRHSLEAILGLYRNVPAEDKETDDAARTVRLGTEMAYMPGVAAELEKEIQKEKLEKVSKEIEAPLSAVLAKMQWTGMSIDAPYFKKLSSEIGKKIEKLTATITEMAGIEFNINSPAQLKAILFERLQISQQGIKKTATGSGLSTAASELEKLRGQHEIIDSILEYRELAKLKSTYVDTIPALANPKTGKVHAGFHQTVTATGRLSSSDPNMQNIPTAETEYGRKVRNGFVAAKGKTLLAGDYSQFELRIAAHIAKEKHMIDAFRKGEDIHWRTAVEMWGEKEAASKRRIAKVINFGILYGMGPQRLAENAGITFLEAREYIEQYFALYKGITAYVERTKEQVKKDGYVETLFGRKRWFKNFALMNKREQAEAERQAINMPIQGSQADIIKLAMVRVDEILTKTYGSGTDSPASMLLQVHDELIFEVQKDMVEEVFALIRPIMEGAFKLDVPIVVNLSTGNRWGDLEKIK